MSFNQLPLRERTLIERAHSQARYYAQRGFYDALGIYCPSLTIEQRRSIAEVVTTFLGTYVVPELAVVINGRGAAPMDSGALWRDTAPSVEHVELPL